MAGLKTFRELSVFLFILLCRQSERNLSEANELVCVCSTPWSSSSSSSSVLQSMSTSPNVSATTSSATSLSQSNSSSASMSQSNSSSASMSQSNSSSASMSQSNSSSASMSQSNSSSASMSQSNSSSASMSQSNSSSASMSQSNSSSASMSQSNSSSARISNESTSSSSSCFCYHPTAVQTDSIQPTATFAMRLASSVAPGSSTSTSTFISSSLTTTSTSSSSSPTTTSTSTSSTPTTTATSSSSSPTTTTITSLSSLTTTTTSSSSTPTTMTMPSTSSDSLSPASTSAPSTPPGSTSATPASPTGSASVNASTSFPMSQSSASLVNASFSSTPPTDSPSVSTVNSSSSASSVQTDSIQPAATISVQLASSVAPDPCSSVVCQNDGQCQNNNGTGVCICAPGFNGSNCEIDIDECVSGPCQNNGTCADGRNSFNCTCAAGYLGDTCSFEDPCLHNPCLNNGTCYVDAPNNYTFFCVCPIPKAYTGQDCGTPVQCFWDIMYSYGKEQGDKEIAAADVKDGFCPGETIDSGLYFFDNQFYEVYICANGMLSFDGEYELNTPIPTYDTDAFPFELAMLTPYWSKIDAESSFCSSPEDCHFNYANRSSVFYQVYTDTSQRQNVTDVLGNASEQVRSNQPEGFRNFLAKWVLVVTWLRLRPDDPSVEEGITNTFQAVLITNGTYTFVKYHYPCGAIEWSAPAFFEGEFRNDYDGYPVAGYNAGDENPDDPQTRSPSLDGSGSYYVKNLDDEDGNTGRQGEYFFRIEERKGDDATAMCNAWHDWQETELKSDLNSADSELTPCPCTTDQVDLDTRFYFDSNATDSECFNSVGQISINKTVTGGRVTADVLRRCCYFKDIGALDVDYSFLKVNYSARPDSVLDDDTAERLCLEESNNFEKFYDVRPINFCDGYEDTLIPRVLIWGDPHIKTLDGKNYTFNGVGEYTVLNADNDAFVLQARTTVAAQGGRNTATIFSVGVAKETGTSKVEVGVKSGGGLEMYIDGTLYAGYNSLTQDVSKDIGGNLRATKKSANCVEVVFKSGSGVEFCEAKEMMSFVVSLASEYFNKTKGLMGRYNKDPNDDFTLPNGTVLLSSLTSRQIHYDFGLNWQITAQQSLFTYGPNENVSTFMNKSFIPMFVEDIVWADNDTRQQAEAQCGGDVVCLFDAASTNDVSVGVNSKDVNIKLVEENKKLSNLPPKFTYVPSCVEVTLGQVAFVNVTASDNNSFTFNVLNKPDGANFTFSRNLLNFTWNVTSSKRVKFSFVVTDELGASASSTPCIKMCACRNGGQCVAPKVRDKFNNDSKFIYQGCACSAGYTGRFCESDIDACDLNGQPCFKGVKCTDQPAPANISGYTCGACPSGYSGDGIKCVDINECGNSSLNNCAQKCTNTPGSFVCSCDPGFKLNSNKHSCDDIDECVPTNDCMHQCNNTIGNYTCYCNDLFVVDPNDSKRCTPSNPCSGNGGCNQVCFKKRDNSTACDCFPGFQLGSDSKTCEDIDECKISGVKCTQKCNNSVGGYNCKCFSGYKLESDGFTCTDINECLDSNLFSCPGKFRVCENIPGNYTCKCQDGLFFINGTCTALKKGETPPEPTVPPPKAASEQERQNSVELRLANMTKDQYNATVDKNLKQTMSKTMDDYCSQEKTECGITSKRRRRALGIFTADHVHLLPGFPVQDNTFLRVAFYILLPSVIQGGGVIPVAVLLQVVNNSKSDLEALFGATIAEIKQGYVPTSPPPSPTNNVTNTSTTTQGSTQGTTQGPTVGEGSNDDWKWIVIGVVIGVVVIVVIVVIVYCVVKKKKQGKVEVTNNGQESTNNAFENDKNSNRGHERHEMTTHHGPLPNEPLV